MDTGEGGAASAGEDMDRELDLLELPAARKPLNSPEEVLLYWNSCYEKEELSHLHFREWWRQKVPKIFSPVPSMNYQKPTEHIEEEDVKRYFFDLLERFLCNGEPAEVLHQLESLNSPPAQCGKVFKMGEPTYSCRDCGLDPTCVLCVDCFKNSEHGSHRYKMSTSVGGGYCDCGDAEAWKEHPYCATHVLGTQSESSDPLAKVPLDIQLRARHVFTGVLKYAYELLTLDTFMKLPGDLQYKERDCVEPLLDDLLEVEDLYTTVLYNDEVHTFDDVITTLQRTLDCDRNLAISFVSLIDREGRSLVKCSSYQQCNEARRIVERITGRRGSKPLKVMVIHSHVVAHQAFAMRLIGWLDSILAYSEGFRALFSRILVEQEVSNGRKQPSILEGMLRHDTVLWKAARSAIHHLLISGMLLEHASKKEFAAVFTNSYGSILKDFINDDHEHSYSVSSLSVQLFTVPTLAHHLIAKHDVLATLLRTFISECERKRNARGKLEFERNLGVAAFRRANYVLIDLKYLLSVPPTEFDDDMRRGFLHGFSLLLEILSWMQNMDCHTRQVNQHVEFEADWENGFNLHIKLAPVIALLLTWCSRDKVVFFKAYRLLLKKLGEDRPEDLTTRTEVSLEGHSAEAATFSVAAGPVSMHLPLSRLLAGLSLLLDTFGLRYTASDFKLPEAELPPVEEIMELPLRTAVMVAQVHAGMWRRNGYSLTHQIFFYHNSRCRGEMYDRDVQLLQFCAAHLPPDQFMLHLLNKFNLVNWASSSFEVSEEESVRHVTTLVEEFLGLLITLVAERHCPGVGRGGLEDMVRQEIVQLLCVEPMSHSALNKALPEDVNHETGLERVIDQVATFKKPTGGASAKGVYELKEEHYGEYNVFFYHFTREDQSKSEEAQRARLKAAGKAQVSPPPVPPRASECFAGLGSLVHCPLMLHILKLVLDRADNLKSRCFSEAQVHKVLYLIGLGLVEEGRDRAEQGPAAEQGLFTRLALEKGLLAAMERLTGSQRVVSHKELLAWTVRQFRQLAGLGEAAGGGMEVAEEEDEGEEARDRRTKAAAERRKRIMAAMANQQKTFMTENATLFEETPSDLAREHKQSVCEWELEDDAASPVCLGPARSAPAPLETQYTCILCQEEEQLSCGANTLVMASYVQRSTVLARRRPAVAPPGPADPATFPFLPADLAAAPHTSSCGHVMHAACWQKYFDDVSESEKRRYRARHPTSFDVEKQEFLCPLCRSLSNSVVPLIPQYHLLQQPGAAALPGEEVVGVAAVVEECDAMETTEELAASPEPSQPLLLHQTEGDRPEVEGPAVGLLDTAVSSSVTVVSSPGPSSVSSSTTELASARSHDGESDGSFMSVEGEPQEVEGEVEEVEEELQEVEGELQVKPEEVEGEPEVKPRAGSEGRRVRAVTIDFSQWLEALFIALKYRRGLSREASAGPVNAGESQPADGQEAEAAPSLPSLTRYYTCPLDQVVEELDQLHHDGASFSRLYLVEEGCELSFPPSVYEIMNAFSQTTYRVGLQGLPGLQDERIPLMVWQSCGFTVHSIVVSAMESGKPLFGSLSSRQNDCLSTFIRFCGVVGSNFGEPKVIRSHSLKLLSSLLEADPENPSILEMDLFTLLVSLTYSLPSLFNGEGPAPLPSCNIQDLHILRLAFLGHITQLLASLESVVSPSLPPRPGFRSPPARDCRPLLDLLQVVRGDPAVLELQPAAVWQEVMVASLGFLRSAALFYHYLSGVAAPAELTELLPPDQEFAHLTKYLGLPASPRHLLDSPFTLVLARRWLSHPGIKLGEAFSYVAAVPRLVPLPRDYSDLINTISSFTCPASCSGEESKMPSMCLVCGAVVCSQSYCCQTELDGGSVGACTAHAHSCGAGTAIFLRVRECKVVMFSGKTKGCFESPPYLDQYGETDEGLRRGNPLSLCPDRYARLHRLWLNHGVAEKVTHNTEASPGFVTTEWVNL